MELQAVDQLEFTSIFGNSTNQTLKPELKGSGFEGVGNEASIFKPVEEKETTKELTPEEVSQVLEEKEEINDESLFNDKTKVDTKEFSSVKSIFEELIKNNQLLPLADDKLETAEDIQALVYSNVMHQVEELKKEENNAWYASKSPAWRVVAEFSEKVSHPSELLPFIQSVQTIDLVSELDPKVEEDAEKIIRMALISRKESQEIIDETISTYKENGKLSNLAEKYQPAVVKAEQSKMEAQIKAKEQEEIANYQMIKQIHEDAVKTLETPFLGKHKMKKEEKAGIYSLIAAPDETSGGYKIFSAIDNLYESKDFEKLIKIALIIQDEKAYNGYVGLDIVKNNSEGLLRKIKTTSTGNGSSEIEDPNPMKQNSLPRFNPNKESGFGYFTK